MQESLLATADDWSALAPDGVGAAFFPRIDSTNRQAIALAGQAPETLPCWVIAGEQTAGRGRQGRAWESGRGNLYASLALGALPGGVPVTALPFVAALAVRDAFVRLGAPGHLLRVKWPNDVLLAERKAAGILIEASGGSACYMVVGIGLNLVRAPDQARFPATSLIDVIGRPVPIKAAFEALAQSFKARFDALLREGFSPQRADWLDVAWGMDTPRELRLKDETLTAIPLDLAEDGGLIVRLTDGSRRTIHAGEVFHLAADQQAESRDAAGH
ncbi:biotin--[acetyl-CoA-carboxylase] ligase [Yunchengibacter salinarum]|uniref:biotin--[acetyl-CoA-carboxylase] ligase n=1 Tax=Yunchengibacter salinarum TaxID=3133399 RepID=UPI0035B577E8